ncbi:universal stress protein [Paraburkholderia sp. Cpub6]|uniref:universal stress protein n=1 Tax=Paraburkholderia sp. Cpub6 TaxID=2723094 RepID=UPI00160A06B9|nr:universal stress protein [Paraburkholderia sp. Cpub6]MBB5462406.1 nucleotide-binding universal stress UspA family protein [Paraburkholderia sp. Cpub6]
MLLTDCAGSASLAREVHCPVLTLPAGGIGRCHVPPARIFVASDDGDASRAAVSEAMRIAADRAAVRVGYVACSPQDRWDRLSHEAVILQPAHEGDDIAQAIGLAAREWRADLLVIGTRGARLTGKWRFASVAEQVAALAVLPMLLVSYSPADR